jgi:hypothetical protein
MREWSLRGQKERSRTEQEVADRLYSELVRARRQGYGVLVVVLQPRSSSEPAQRPAVAGLVQDLVRRYDHVLRLQRDVFSVIAPDVEPVTGRQLVERLQAGTRMAVGAARYPEDGTAVEGLLHTAATRARGQVDADVVAS